MAGWLVPVLLLAVAAAISAAPATHVIHEARDIQSGRWIKRGRVPQDAKLPVRVALAQSNLDNAEQILLDVSHPDSLNYGKHWTSEAVITYFRPSDETVDAVRTWLIDNGIDNDTITHSDNRAWLAMTATAQQMEALLHTEYHEHEDQLSGNIMPACDHYHVPRELQKHIDYISPGIKLLAPASAHRRRHGRPELQTRDPDVSKGLPNDLKHCSFGMTPICIAALYNITEARLSHPSNSMGIFEQGNQHWDQSDLNLFFNKWAPRIPRGTHPKDLSIDGGVAENSDTALRRRETMLDLDVAYPIVYPQTITILEDDDSHYGNRTNDTYTWGFNTFLDAIDGSYCRYCAFGECGDLAGVDPVYPDPAQGGYKGKLQCGVFEPTNVISLSYGGQEADVPIAYQKRQCMEYLKLGLQGVTFLFASGDFGVSVSDDDPVHVYGPVCLGKKENIFNPTWPVNCPWVTAVGGTQIPFTATVLQPEHGWERDGGSSGGGFSNLYPIPHYQQAATKEFFAKHAPPYKSYEGLVATPKDVYSKPRADVSALAGSTGSIYNRIGRGIPDVAAVASLGVTCQNSTCDNSGGGTSMAAPIFAAIINRINEERIASGKAVVGFINPALYAHPQVLNDITKGNNPGCDTMGFEAVQGWDPVTGLGSPDYGRMLEMFMSLP